MPPTRTHLPRPTESTAPETTGRWPVLTAAVGMQLALGSLYCWPIFGRSLTTAMHLSPGQATEPFQLALGVIFLGTYVGGRVQDTYGPRAAVIIGGTLYATGTLMAATARGTDDFWIVLVGYGLLGGFGCGIAYVVPAALLQRWFPDRATLATAIAVAGFGAGGAITTLVAGPLLLDHPTRPAVAFLPLGIGYLGATLIAAAWFEAPAANSTTSPAQLAGMTLNQALRRPQWWLLTATLTVNVGASVGFIATAAMSGSAIAHLNSAQTATMISLISICNGAGRVVWAALAERVGHTHVLAALLATQTVCLALITKAHSPPVFCLLAAGIGLCCGGGFGVMPAATGGMFGLRHLGKIYGLMLAGWSIGGVMGPWLVSALATSSPTGGYHDAYLLLAAIAAASVALPVAARPHRRPGHWRAPIAAGQPRWASSATRSLSGADQ